MKKPVFSLGTDGVFCLEQAKLLKPFDDSNGMVFKWQDGSSDEIFEVHDSGKYWVTVKNLCGVTSDTIHIVRKEVEEVNLGPDKILCDQDSHWLDAWTADLSDKTFLWNTGQTSTSIKITQSGLYSVQVSTSCWIDKDTVNVVFLSKPPSFSLGEDENSCLVKSRVLMPYTYQQHVEFEWQDGSTKGVFTVNDVGTYWVTVRNACGVESDTLRISKIFVPLDDIPNIITPNDDSLNQYFILGIEDNSPNRLTIYNRWGEEVYKSLDYKNDWNGYGLPSGVYFYQLFGECFGEKRGSVTISR